MSTAVTSSTSSNPYDVLNGQAAGTPTTKNDAASTDRFLKLLVAQLQNQDPLNPMDNAQVTSQMAQISTVDGIEKLNTTVGGLNTQFVQMQALQGASLVGRDVVVLGNQLSVNDKGLSQGAYDLASKADSVTVEVLNGAGSVIDTIDMGPQDAGRQGFDWVPSAGVDATQGATFRITAKSGATAVGSTALMRDTVDAVSTSGDKLTLQLRRTGDTAYSDIKAFI